MGRVIALSGYKGSGKDTVAEYLQKEYGYVRFSFASRLKDMVARDYDLPRSDMDDRIAKEAPIYSLPTISTDAFTGTIHDLLVSELSSGYWTPRALCILEGSVKRSVYPNYWVREIANRIISEPELDYVISDMRYTSEADTLRLLLPRVELVRIHRHDSVSTQDPSERDLDGYTGFDTHIMNDREGDIDALHTSVDTMLRTR